MATPSPSLEGLRVIFRRPSLMAFEIAWRFGFGLCALVLVGAWWLRFLGGLPVTSGDVAALRGGDRDFAALALLHILQGTGPRLARGLVILVPALALLWMLLATWGRAATLKILWRAYPPPEFNPLAPPANVLSILGLNFLRVACLLLMVIAVCVAILGASYASVLISSSPERPNLLVYFLIVLVTLPPIVLAWLAANWLVSLAPIFCSDASRTTFSAVSAAARAVRLHRRAYAAVSSAFGAIRLLALLLVTFLATMGAVLAGAASIKTVIVVVVVLSLGYFAFADLLYIARFMAYLRLATEPAVILPPSMQVPDITADGQLSPS